MQNTSSKKQASPRKRVSPAKKKLALEVIGRLKKEYPVAECTLDYENAWQLLVSVRLAAQCTDARVDQITPLLYEKFPDVPALAAAEPEQIEEIVRPCGLGRSKARDISACMRVLHEKYDDHVPETFEELLALPGVGRKSANLIMGDVFGKPAIVTDTHCIRLCNLIGLVDGIKEPAKVEFLRKREMISATASFTTDGLYVSPAGRSAANAVCRISAGTGRLWSNPQITPQNDV